MGARPQDYERASPYKSYIHVDDFDGPKELAEFLKKLEENDDMYNEYFRWKVRKSISIFLNLLRLKVKIVIVSILNNLSFILGYR